MKQEGWRERGRKSYGNKVESEIDSHARLYIEKLVGKMEKVVF
jgi:hypothetical protein